MKKLIKNLNRTIWQVTIGYAYPTSEHAERAGFGEDGCWTVVLINRMPMYLRGPQLVSGHPTPEEAAKAAIQMVSEGWEFAEERHCQPQAIDAYRRFRAAA